MSAALLLVLAYLVGAIPSGLFIGKWLGGVDLREHCSKNIGFTNAVRVLGWKLGVPVLVIDVGKAWSATALLAGPLGAPGLEWLAGLGVMVGNLFNAFLKFKGGKGVASGLGVFLALSPLGSLAALLAFLLMLATTRIVSVGSLLAAVVLPVVHAVAYGPGPSLWIAIAASLFVIVKHRANIARLRAGTETRLGKAKPPA